MSSYTIDGVTQNFGPTQVQWIPKQMGMGHDGRAIYATTHTIVMSFAPTCVADAKNWLDNASGGSVNLRVLDRWNLSWVTLSSVYMTVTQPPVIENVTTGPFTITVTGAIPPNA